MIIELLDHMGDDLRVVNAARVSMHKTSEYVPDGTLKAEDAKLIAYLAKNEHFTPFTHVMLTLRLSMPIFVAREWFRHTVGFTRNEVSRRYVTETPRCYEPYYLRKASASVKQGSVDEEHTQSPQLIEEAKALTDRAVDFYEMAIASGIAPEQARMYLPQSMMTEFVETASLYAYARLCHLRLDGHAQKEIREYAQLVSAECRKVAPVSWAALMNGGEK